MERKVLSILVPTYNRKSKLKDLLNSLKINGYIENNNIEIIISDNASTDGTIDYLKKLSYPIIVISNPTNIGFSQNCYRLSLTAVGDYTLLIGDDDKICIRADKLVELLLSKGKDIIFTEREDYKSIVSNKYNENVAFGFISNTIQPNNDEYNKLFVEAVKNDNGHDSPHFIARWRYYYQNPSKLLEFDSNILEYEKDVIKKISIKKYLYKISVVYKKDNSYNWYKAYQLCIKYDNLYQGSLSIKNSFNIILRSDYHKNKIFFLTYYSIRLLFLIIQDYKYSVFIYKRLRESYK